MVPLTMVAFGRHQKLLDMFYDVGSFRLNKILLKGGTLAVGS